ncbi:MAG: hypothetical protein WCT52_01815 [Candidatus Micrarchaeia archaeon]
MAIDEEKILKNTDAYTAVMFGGLFGAFVGIIFSLFILPFTLRGTDGRIMYFATETPMTLPLQFDQWQVFVLGMFLVFLVLFAVMATIFQTLLRWKSNALKDVKLPAEYIKKNIYWIVGIGLLVSFGIVGWDSTKIIALSTVAYTLMTMLLVLENKAMREAQTEPRMSVYLKPREESINLMDLNVENIGMGPAFDINFKIEPDFACMGTGNLSTILNKIAYLTPKNTRSVFLTSMLDNFEEKKKTKLLVKVSYKDKNGKQYTEEFTLDFSEFVGLTQIGKPPLHEIADNTEKISKAIEGILSSSDSFRKPEIIVTTRKEIADERQKLTKEMKKKFEAQKKEKQNNV